MIAAKAQGAALMVQRYKTVRNEGEKLSAVVMLNEMFTDIRCHHHPTLGLIAFYNQEKMKDLPKGIAFGASLVVMVGRDGKGTLMKNRFGLSGMRFPTPEMTKSLKILVPAEGPPKTRWDFINEGWIWP